MHGTIADQRQWLGLTTEMVAAACGISHDRYVQIDTAEIVPSQEEADKIIRVLFGSKPPQPVPAEMHDALATLTEHDRDEVLRFQDFLSRRGRVPQTNTARSEAREGR
jgi:hypothetical protein